MTKRTNPEFHNPTATEAINRAGGNVNNREPVSIMDSFGVEPLSKYNSPDDYKGRSRLLRELNKQIATTPKTDRDTLASLKEQKRVLERMQFASRVTPGEIELARGLRKTSLYSRRR